MITGTVHSTWLAAVLSAALASYALGDTLLVPSQYSTIQAAIDAAQPSDEVVIADGTYTGPGNKNLDFGGKGITVRSASGDPNTCIIDCEQDGRGFYFHSRETTSAVVSGLTIRNGAVGDTSPAGPRGGGVYCSHSSPTLAKCVILHSTASSEVAIAYAGGIFSTDSSLVLIDCDIVGNTTYSSTFLARGGGICCWINTGTPRVINCRIIGNRARSGSSVASGGGLHCEGYYLRPLIYGCMITNNVAASDSLSGRGGGIYCSGGAIATIADCAITANVASSGGGAINCSYSTTIVSISNSILWSNAPDELSTSTSTVNVTASDIRGGWPGTGNIDTDPLFVRNPNDGGDGWGNDPNTPDIDEGANDDFGDLRLLPASPCIDAGDSGAVPADTLDLDGDGDTTEPLPFDLGGRPRFADISAKADTGVGPPPIVDMGAYESQELRVPAQYATIQAAIDAARPGDDVVIADGVYTGAGNKNIDFHGKPIKVRSAGGPTTCIIDCQNSGRGVWFHSAETASSALQGITIRNGRLVQAGSFGGGILCESGSGPTIANCVLSNNTVAYGGGGGIACMECTDSNCFPSNPIIRDCIITGNRHIYAAGTGGGGIYCDDSSPQVVGCVIRDNTSSQCGGGIYCSGLDARLSLTRSTILHNTASYDGGGIYATLAASLQLDCCHVGSNAAGGMGGGIDWYGDGPVQIRDTLVAANSASQGGGVVLKDVSSFTACVLLSSTLIGNTASSYGGLMVWGEGADQQGIPSLANSIVWGNSASTAPQIGLCGAPGNPAQLAVNRSDVQGGQAGIQLNYGTLDWSVGNIDSDPLFVNPANSDYHLAGASPCIDAGDNAAVPPDALDLDGDGNTTEPLPFDLDGHPRFVDDPATPDCPYAPDTCGTAPIVDMGAYEYQASLPPGDLNCDGQVNNNDLAAFVLALLDPSAYQLAYPACSTNLADMNADGSVDGGDTQAFVNLLLGS